MRILFRLFLGFTLLLGGVEFLQARPQVSSASCCGGEDTCPCPPPAPSAPRCPSPVQGQTLVAPVTAPVRAERQEPRKEAHPCPAVLASEAVDAEIQPGLRPRPAPRASPPDISTRLALLSTFRN